MDKVSSDGKKYTFAPSNTVDRYPRVTQYVFHTKSNTKIEKQDPKRVHTRTAKQD